MVTSHKPRIYINPKLTKSSSFSPTKPKHTNMNLHLFITLFSTIISTTLLLSPPSTTAGHPLPPPPTTTTNYLTTTCKTTTLYPQTCITTLSKYSTTINNNPNRLATIAIRVALSHATKLSSYISALSHHLEHSSNTTNGELSAVVRDCATVVGDAVDGIKKSYKEMKGLGWGGESVRFGLSNVQTWMSAALTDEDTCVDGFDEVVDGGGDGGGGGVRVEVCGRVVVVKEVTSNALALVNSYKDMISG